MDFNCSSLGHTGSFILPFPKVGEKVYDMRDFVEWEINSKANPFGDSHNMRVLGSLVVTELRILFIPYQISGPLYMNPVDLSPNNEQRNKATPPIFRDINDIRLIRKLTVQIPINLISDSKLEFIDPYTSILSIFVKDSNSFNFLVYRNKKIQKGIENENLLDELSPDVIKYNELIYKAGLDSKNINPSSWCMRVCDFIYWNIKENVFWLKFGECLYKTSKKYTPGNHENIIETTKLSESNKQLIRKEFERIGAVERY
jgi:hypothetical protein